MTLGLWGSVLVGDSRARPAHPLGRAFLRAGVPPGHNAPLAPRVGRAPFGGRLLGILLAAALAGCGSRSATVTVRGMVTLDGKPVEGAAVMIEPSGDGVPAIGMTDASGRFKIEAPSGKSRVAISKTVPASAAQGVLRADEGVQLSGNADRVRVKYLTPIKYASALTSGLTLDVRAGMDPVRLAITSK